MAKPKRKLTAAQRRAKKKRRKETMIIFINGKQKRVRRPPTIDGMDVDEFIERNADPIWLHQNEMWELIEPEPGFLTDEEAFPSEAPSGMSYSNRYGAPEYPANEMWDDVTYWLEIDWEAEDFELKSVNAELERLGDSVDESLDPKGYETDIEVIIRRLAAEHPNVCVERLKVSHARDDDGLWFLSAGDKVEIQLESSTFNFPFFVESNIHEKRMMVHSVEEAIRVICEELGI